MWWGSRELLGRSAVLEAWIASGDVYTAKRHRDVITHRLDPDDRPALRTIGGFRVSSPERTILDICGTEPSRVAARVLEDALRKGLTTLDRLWEDLELDGGHGRTGTSLAWAGKSSISRGTTFIGNPREWRRRYEVFYEHALTARLCRKLEA